MDIIHEIRVEEVRDIEEGKHFYRVYMEINETIKKKWPIVPAVAKPINKSHWFKLGITQKYGKNSEIKIAPVKPVNIRVNSGWSKVESFLVEIIYKA